MKKRWLLLGCLWAIPGMLAALEITLSTPADGATMPLLNKAQKAFVTMPHKERIAFYADAAKRKELVKAGYVPLPVKFAWTSDASARASFRVLVAESPDMKDPLAVTGKDGAAQIDNLKIGWTYYWQVEAAEPGAKPVLSAVRRFTTEAQAPRLMRFPDVPNVRDLGGRPAMNGMRVRQDRIFRTAGMNFNAKWIPAKNDEELFRAYPEYKPILTMYQDMKKRLAADPASLPVVPYRLKSKWTVFKTGKADLSADEMKSLDTLAAVPAELFGVKPVVMEANKRSRLEIPLDGKGPQTAVLMQEFTSPSDGVMQIASGGDFAWCVRVNGQMVYSRMQGNGKAATTSNYFYFVPVRKGKNVITVVLKSADKRWMWCCGKRKQQDLAKNLDETVKELKKTPVRWEPGASRVKPEGRAIFLDHYKVKSDIDLRSDRECMGMTGSPLGESVTWYHISSSAYGGMQYDFGKQQFTKVFRVFLDEKNYPVIFHCIAGQDRTGAVAFILNGLLGVEEEELYLDWEVTAFWNPSAKFNHALRFDHLIGGFRKLPGKDMHEQIENYVLSLGFTKDDIAHFRALMLEKR